MWEVVLSLHVLQDTRTRRHRLVFDGWRRIVCGDLRRGGLDEVTSGMLIPLAPASHYFPDFLTPAEGVLGLEEGIEAVLRTPRRRLRGDLELLGSWSRVPSWAQCLAAGDTQILASLGDALRSYYKVALEPYWPRIRARVDADRALRARALLDGGPHAMLAGLHPKIRWRPPVLEIDHVNDRDIHLNGRGITLIPSHFCRQNPIPLYDPALPPVLVYPIEKDVRWMAPEPSPDEAADALTALLGRTRAAMLRAAVTGTTTTDLARCAGVTPPTASEHTDILRRAGLIISRRHRNRIIHTLTPLGVDLLRMR